MNFFGNRALSSQLLIAGCVLLLIAGCTAKAPVTKPDAATKEDPYDFKSEGNIPPLKRTEVVREADFEEVPLSEEEVLGEDVEISPEESVLAPPVPEEPTVPGFRVQVFATSDQETADAVREAARHKLGLPAYIEVVDELYKVRIGDCYDREEAEAVLQRCKDAGYGDSWIVETQVKAPEAP
jgi:cell division septation protein DedD